MRLSNLSAILATGLGIAIFLVLGTVLISSLVPASALAEGGSIILVETLFILGLSVVPVVWRFSRVGIKALYEPLTLMSVAIILYYVARGQLLMVRELIAQPDSVLDGNPANKMDVAAALGYAIVGVICFHAGYRFWEPPSPPTQAYGGGSWLWSKAAIRNVTIWGFVVASISSVILVYVSGGIGNIVANLGRLRVETTGYGYVLVGLAYWPIIFAFGLSDRLRRGKNPTLVLLILAVANLIDALFGNRSGVLAVWVTGLLLYVGAGRGQRVGRKFLLTVAALTLAVGFLLPMARIREQANSVDDSFRIGGEYWGNEASGIALNGLGEFVALDSFSTLLSAGPDMFPFRYGETYLDVILFTVPRALWPDKPRSFSYAIGQYIQSGGDTDIPPGFIGELYINFHVAGVIVGMYLMGLLLRRIQRWTMKEDPVAATVYAVLAPYIIVFMGRSFVGGGVLALIPALLMIPVTRHLRASHQRREVAMPANLAEMRLAQ